MSLAPFDVKMANGMLVKPKGLIRDVKIHIHSIPYIVIFIVLNCWIVKSNYRMLLGQHCLRHARVIHEKGNNKVHIMGNDTVKTIKINC